MIASVRGTVRAVHLDSAVVEVGGVGMLVHATPATLAGLRPGQPAGLETALVVREDALTLYGFADADEREVFEIVQTVSGIGPRLALAMLAVHSPEGLRRAVAEEDLTALMRVPGIGRKGAQRLALELGDRLGSAGRAENPIGPAPGNGGGSNAQVVQALMGLGWNARQAEDAVNVVSQSQGPSDGDVPMRPVVADVAALLRAALRHLGRS